MTKSPRGAAHMLPAYTGAEARAAVLAAFPQLRDVFESGIGLRLMNRESNIMVAVLLRLIGEGIACRAAASRFAGPVRVSSNA